MARHPTQSPPDAPSSLVGPGPSAIMMKQLFTLAVFFISVAVAPVATVSAGPSPIPVIFDTDTDTDTDIGFDIDDTWALDTTGSIQLIGKTYQREFHRHVRDAVARKDGFLKGLFHG